VIAATSRSLAHQIAHQAFRHDIYFRLAQHSLTLPPLRDRKADLELLVRTILNELGSTQALTKEAYARLQSHNWPGNTRELFDALSAAVIFTEGASVIDAKSFNDLGAVAVPLQTRDDDRQPEPIAPVSARTVQFPDLVRELAARAWQMRAMPPLDEVTQYVRRATYRAILLSLRVTHGDASFPPALNAAWRTLFRAKWDAAGAGRGL
jgi:DNA-binding NtrC family response regulator